MTPSSFFGTSLRRDPNQPADLNARIEGKTDEEAKKMITDAIQGSDEWRRVHESKK